MNAEAAKALQPDQQTGQSNPTTNANMMTKHAPGLFRNLLTPYTMEMLRHGIVLILMVLICETDLIAQPKFLYGMYATGWGGNEGVSWTGTSFAKRTGPGGIRLMTFWNEALGMNTFFLNSSNFPEGGEDNAPYLNYLHREYAVHPVTRDNFIYSSKIIPIYRCFLITRAAETHYLQFSPATAKEGNVIDFDNSTFAVSTGANAYTVSAKSSSLSGQLIRGLNILGGENRQLRPREWNTTGTSAAFKLHFRFSAAQASNSLTVNLTNKASRAGNKNYQVIDKTFPVPAGNSEVVLPFTLAVTGGQTTYEAYVYRLGLKVNCTLQPGGSFQLKDITVYDDSGRVVVEETSKFFSLKKRRDLVTAFKSIANGIAGSSASQKVYPIIAVADEPHVGNYAPMDAICKYLSAQDSRLTFYSTWPDDDAEHRNLNTVGRFVKVGLHYVGPNHYAFRTGNTDSRSSVYGYYVVLARFCEKMRSAAPQKTIISVPQMFSGGGDFRAPTRSELLSSAYLSLVAGAKGVVCYYSGPIWAKEEPLYTYHDDDGSFDRMFSLNTMDPEKVAALKTFGDFINAKSGESGGITNGDLFARYGVDKHCIVGTRDGIDIVNTRSFAADELGTSARAEVAGISIVNENGTTASKSTMIGVAHLADNSSTPTITYYLIANLNSWEADVRLRISLRSSNSRNSVRVSNLTFPNQQSNQLFPKNGVVPATLPAHAAMILKIQNSD
jgi:hypothetical protein